MFYRRLFSNAKFRTIGKILRDIFVQVIMTTIFFGFLVFSFPVFGLIGFVLYINISA